ncbi:Lipoprotein-releasing system ATP-binding protein LolD [Limnobacter sp. 130]|uniref:ABC transporter ATP-binding protein n=1 Tax=Limnobacter sp. 130 TaxID=2653147 RepID=UPI0012F42375|nr:ABC transporter ATP-binding protein [Limnobacter sp. 130]VWX36272.1 Lipoprotein-releasing system ATP-binding protein LolD [Limnobacter sp. 130]
MNQAHANTATLAVAGVSKTLGGVQLFKDVNLQLQQGESLAVVGESGSGKSTLLHLMAALDQPDTGEVYWADKNICTLNTNQVAAIRLRHVGLVFQAYYLMPHLSARQNVELPFLLAGQKPDSAHASLLLEQVGMAHKANSFPREMSGGEQQRVAIARALALNPPLILADEPTGNLDEDNAERVLQVLLQACNTHGCALVMVTHSMKAAGHLNQQLSLAEHRLV